MGSISRTYNPIITLYRQICLKSTYTELFYRHTTSIIQSGADFKFHLISFIIIKAANTICNPGITKICEWVNISLHQAHQIHGPRAACDYLSKWKTSPSVALYWNITQFLWDLHKLQCSPYKYIKCNFNAESNYYLQTFPPSTSAIVKVKQKKVKESHPCA
jgi:hypothetical protein